MKNESSTSNGKPIYIQFTCPECGGHTLKAIVEFHADVSFLEKQHFSITFDMEQESEKEHEIALFYCSDCGDWDTDKTSVMMDHVE